MIIMENEVKTKVCKKCGQELPLDQFYTSVNCKDGHLNVCKNVKINMINCGINSKKNHKQVFIKSL